MKKLLKILFVLVIICLFILITVQGFVEKKTNPKSLVGSKWSGGNITTSMYSKLLKIYDSYITLLKNDKYEEAYKSLWYEYKVFKNFESFKNEVQLYNYDGAILKNISIKAENLFEIKYEIDEIEHLICVLVDVSNDGYTIIPDGFLEHCIYDKKIKKNRIKYNLIDTENYVSEFIANVEIENNTNSELKINQVFLKDGLKKYNYNMDEDIILLSKEKKTIKIVFNTDLTFPDELHIVSENIVSGKGNDILFDL